MQEKNPKEIMQEFHVRQSRQIVAIAAALFLVLLMAVIHKRPDLFGEHSKSTIFGIQAILIAAFFGYSFVNWRCPSCRKRLGPDIHQPVCKKCGARLR